MIDRRTFVAAATGMLMSSPALGQRASRVPRIGMLTPGSNPREKWFWEGMRDLDYVEGKNIIVDRRSADGDFERLPALAAELVQSRVDVIVAIGSASSSAAKQATSTVPIVMVGANDPVASGLVGNLGRPGGNITGTSSQSTSAIGKMVELMRQIVPGSTKVVALWNPVNVLSQQLRMGHTLISAARLNITVRLLEVRKRDDLDRAFHSLHSEPPDAVFISADTFFLGNAPRIAELAIGQRLPVFGTTSTLAEAGILATYGASLQAFSRRAAPYVKKLLTGAKPGDLPVELPTKFETVINEKTAAAIGITVPPRVLALADQLIR